MKYIVTLNNNNYEVDVDRGQATVVKSQQAAAPVVAQPVAPVAAQPTAPAPSVASAAPGQTAAGTQMTAPMPGLVLRIIKNVGDSVKKGEAVLVIEAMKMECEIFSPIDGAVVQIVTSKGANVSTGDLLAVIR